jgi:predicted RNase H-like HicB family nuclease
MIDRYPAILRKARGTDYGVEFPDLPGCFSAGSSPEDARKMASEALRFHLDGMTEDRVRIPKPSSLDALEKQLKRAGIGADFFAVVEIEAEQEAAKVARVNVTLDERLLTEIDREAQARGTSRSGLLAEAARALLRRKSSA